MILAKGKRGDKAVLRDKNAERKVNPQSNSKRKRAPHNQNLFSSLCRDLSGEGGKGSTQCVGKG